MISTTQKSNFLFYAGACDDDEVRLYSKNSSSAVTDNGMIQICQDGQWVAVCDYGWTQTHSIVVCKELGYSNPSENLHLYNILY